jgi:hypothetical protein
LKVASFFIFAAFAGLPPRTLLGTFLKKGSKPPKTFVMGNIEKTSITVSAMMDVIIFVIRHKVSLLLSFQRKEACGW